MQSHCVKIFSPEIVLNINLPFSSWGLLGVLSRFLFFHRRPPFDIMEGHLDGILHLDGFRNQNFPGARGRNTAEVSPVAAFKLWVVDLFGDQPTDQPRVNHNLSSFFSWLDHCSKQDWGISRYHYIYIYTVYIYIHMHIYILFIISIYQYITVTFLLFCQTSADLNVASR